MNLFFRNALHSMNTDSIDFNASIIRLIPGEEDRFLILNALKTIFPNEIFSSRFEQYLLITGLSSRLADPAFSSNKVKVHLNTKGNIYWRVRLKNQEWVTSEWSEVSKL
jgi:hypothetical protein